VTRFSYESAVEGPEARLRLHGELDMSATLKLEPEVDRLLDGPVRRLVIELSDLEFIDSTGFSLLVSLTERTQASGAELVLRRPSEPVARALRVTGLDEVLPLVDMPAA
jgi:anti-sigma B factor antagonist